MRRAHVHVFILQNPKTGNGQVVGILSVPNRDAAFGVAHGAADLGNSAIRRGADVFENLIILFVRD